MITTPTVSGKPGQAPTGLSCDLYPLIGSHSTWTDPRGPVRPPRSAGISHTPQMRPENEASAGRPQLSRMLGSVCKTVGYAFGGSNPPPATSSENGP